MKSFTFSIPQNIVMGEGALKQLPQIAAKIGGKKAYIVSDPVLKQMGTVDACVGYLKEAGLESDEFTETEGNPSVETVEKATEGFKASGADFLVALGGGSAMDVAKAVGVVATYGGSITEYEGAQKVPGDIVPQIAIPTTAGTGSEVTAFSVITDHSRNYKLTVFSYKLLPAYVILDPELLATVPASVAAACGMDAFIHAMESYISVDASPFTEAMSEKAMELIRLIVEPVEVGAIYEGEVVRIMNFGAFVQLAPNKDGLIHISKLSRDRVNKVEDVVNIGDKVRVKVLEIDKMGRINLALREKLS